MNQVAQLALEAARAAIAKRAASSNRTWTQSEVQRLKDLYPDTPMPKLMEALGKPSHAIYRKAHALGLEKTAVYLASQHSGRLRREDNPGAGCRFRPGHKPWNKGARIDVGGRSVETRFAPGSVPHNNVPVGTERVTDDGILQRKVRDDGPSHHRWKSVHSILWEESHGPIPPGHLVVFKDRNPQNIELENLELVSRAENMRRNTIHRYPPELKATIRQLSKLKRAISEASSEKQDD